MAYLISLLCSLCWCLIFVSMFTQNDFLAELGYGPFIFLGGAIAIPVFFLKEKHPNKYVYRFNLFASSALVIVPFGLGSLLLTFMLLLLAGGGMH